MTFLVHTLFSLAVAATLLLAVAVVRTKRR